jgi:hypothetical protein
MKEDSMNSHILKRKLMLFPLLLVLASITVIGAAEPSAPLVDCPGSGTTITSDTSWTSDCTLTASTTVDSGATLTVSPGVTVEVKSTRWAGRLTINGTLVANGTAADPIVFTSGWASPEKGDWEDIRFNSSSSNNVLDYATVEYAGACCDYRAVDIRTDSLTMTNSTVRSSETDGVGVTNASPTISDGRFDDNGGGAILLSEASFPALSALSASGNGFNGVIIDMGPETIDTDYTWGNNGLPYRLADNVTVDQNVTLTIAQGTTVEVKNSRWAGRLTINGTLEADGTAADPIKFTSGWASPAKGDWEDIRFNSSSSNSVLDYVTVEYAGACCDYRAVDIRTDSLTMTNSTVRSSETDGVGVTNASPTISDSSFNDNGNGAIVLREASFPGLSALSASGNGFNGVVIDMGPETVDTDYTWGNNGLPYRLAANVTVDENTTLTVAKGTTVEVKSSRWAGRLTINGTLVADGTAADPILFTSGWPSPAKGDWEDIRFNSSSSNNVLDYVTVEYAGACCDVGSVSIRTSSLTMTNSTVQRSKSDGISVVAGRPSITHNNIIENNGFGLRNDNPATPVPATCNWWGANSGPDHAGNPSGTGQEVSDGVIYDPWLVDPAPGGACTGGRSRIYLPTVIRLP